MGGYLANKSASTHYFGIGLGKGGQVKSGQ